MTASVVKISEEGLRHLLSIVTSVIIKTWLELSFHSYFNELDPKVHICWGSEGSLGWPTIFHPDPTNKPFLKKELIIFHFSKTGFHFQNAFWNETFIFKMHFGMSFHFQNVVLFWKVFSFQNVKGFVSFFPFFKKLNC